MYPENNQEPKDKKHMIQTRPITMGEVKKVKTKEERDRFLKERLLNPYVILNTHEKKVLELFKKELDGLKTKLFLSVKTSKEYAERKQGEKLESYQVSPLNMFLHTPPPIHKSSDDCPAIKRERQEEKLGVKRENAVEDIEAGPKKVKTTEINACNLKPRPDKNIKSTKSYVYNIMQAGSNYLKGGCLETFYSQRNNPILPSDVDKILTPCGRGLEPNKIKDVLDWLFEDKNWTSWPGRIPE
eukprot:GHVP01015981.1.p1 GENE.GHVP01015981.1~~GHVP01015981.1.p1  ORF type:complete len:242 (+),score=41.95 GHVP01015981.1:326-1051(+)